MKKRPRGSGGGTSPQAQNAAPTSISAAAMVEAFIATAKAANAGGAIVGVFLPGDESGKGGRWEIRTTGNAITCFALTMEMDRTMRELMGFKT